MHNKLIIIRLKNNCERNLNIINFTLEFKAFIYYVVYKIVKSNQNQIN